MSRVVLRIFAIPTNQLSGVMQWSHVFPAYWSTSLQFRCLLTVPRAPTCITIGMTDTLLQFQILICTSTFKSLKWSIFSVSFSATRASKGQATLTMKYTFPSFSRTTIGTFSSDDEHVNVNYRKLENEPWCYHACPNGHELVVHTSLRTPFAAIWRPVVNVSIAWLIFFYFLT